MPRTGGFSVAWQKHSSVMCAGFSQLQQNAEFVDMTLAADGHFIRVHQMVIGLASPYLKELIRSSPTPHPVVFLNNVSHKVLCCILEYMYTGEVIVPADLLRNFIEIGKALCVRGLEDMQSNASPQDAKDNESEQQRVHAEDHESYEVVEMIEEDHPEFVKTETELVKAHVYTQDVTPSKKSFHQVSKSGKVISIQSLPKKRDMPSINTIPAKVVRMNMEEMPEESVEHEEQVIQEEYLDSLDPEAETEDQPPTQKTEIMFTVSNMGGLQLILNRYLYRIRSIYKDGRRRWQCVDENKKCRAQAITKDDILLSRTSMHNHPFHDKRIMAKVRKNAVFANIEKADSTCAREHIPQSD